MLAPCLGEMSPAVSYQDVVADITACSRALFVRVRDATIEAIKAGGLSGDTMDPLDFDRNLSSAETLRMIDETSMRVMSRRCSEQSTQQCRIAAKDPSERVQVLNLTAHDALKDRETNIGMGSG
eukprot:3046205-Pleurochrysis_carterae.AAC.4